MTPADGPDVAVEVRSVVLDPSTDSPIVLLEERQGERTLSIWIGDAEARSIAVQLGHVEWPRPNAHDLAKRLLMGLGGRVERVVVTELRGSTYFAVLVVRAAAGLVEIDARPSDAIAIALRVNAPVYVRDELLEAAVEKEERNAGDEPRLAL
jgi:bifunctional DNase/RNase